MGVDKYTFGKIAKSWHADRAQTVTFVVTDDCNLACKYCYISHKNCYTKMDLDTAKKFVDQLLTTDSMRYSEAVILEFIGGEPMMEAELIDKIVDYFKLTAFMLDHDWYWNYRISICTNGVNYSSEPVQCLIKKNYNKIAVTISLDGVKEKHDMQRIFPDGSGSFDSINKNVDLWLSQFSGTTKITFSSDDLPLLYDSIVYLWDRGIKEVSSNVVFENVWKEGDPDILEHQLKKLADYVLDNQLFDKGYYCSFFDESIGFPYADSDYDQTFCGAGKMIALSPTGKLFPCLRYYGYSLNNHQEWSVGDVETGVDMEKVRPFVLSTNRLQSDDECLNCGVATGCGFCQGFNYDESQTGTNFYRAKYICQMHKARVRANDYFFSRLYNIYGIQRQLPHYRKKSLYVLMDDAYVTYCCSENKNLAPNRIMTPEVLNESLEYARNQAMNPFIVHSKYNILPENWTLENHVVVHLLPYNRIREAIEKGYQKIVPIYNLSDISKADFFMSNVILNVRQEELGNLSKKAIELFNVCDRINFNYLGLDKSFESNQYKEQLELIGQYIIDVYKNENRQLEFSVLTDGMFLEKHENCGAGERKFIASPEGKLYACAGMMKQDLNQYIGSVWEGINIPYDAYLYRVSHSNLCGHCEAYQCNNCVHTNRSFTREINVSPSFQCVKGNIEKEVSSALEAELFWNPKKVEEDVPISNGKFYDPIKVFTEKESVLKGYYHTCV